MNFLRSGFRNFSSAKGKFVIEKLNHRDIIRVCGNEVIPFLQGLITNDMNHFDRGSKSMYTMFLNKNGRVLYDSIIFKTIQSNVFLIECDKDVSDDLMRHLRLFRVRKKIDIDSVGDNYTTWVLFDPEKVIDVIDLPNQSADVISSIDPRLRALGCRLILPNSFEKLDLNKLFPTEIELTCTIDGENDYKLHRYKLGVGEGIVDHPPTKCFPLETNCDYLHGVSFHKGCYVGQELTARTYHTGTTRKRLMPTRLLKQSIEEAKHVQLPNGTNVGTIRDVKGKIALALIRLEQALKANELLVNQEKAEIIRPDWWPVAQKTQKVAATDN